jgi:hypothetical protein
MAGRPIFSLAERVFAWEDIVLAAYVWGEIARLELRIARADAAERALVKRGQQPTEDDVDEATTRWRYDHDLISADDLDAWLAARELDADEWLAYVRRAESLARAGEVRPGGRASSVDVDASLYAEAMCSGTIGAVAQRLAQCAAAHGRAVDGGRRRAVPTAKVRAALDRLPPAITKRGLYDLNAAESRKRVEVIVRASADAERFANDVGAGELIEHEIESYVLEWTRLRCRALRFDAEDAAREAALLIREDGLTIAKVAAASKTRVRVMDVVLEDVDGALRDRLVGARPKDLVGPVLVEDAFLVAVVEQRVPPTSKDRDVRKRAKDRVVQRALGAEVDRRIRWHERF